MASTSSTVVTRFAPSPTGALHVGGARTALYSWAFARQHGGRFILRMEDTDQARSTPQSTRGILHDLLWLGINWDEGPDADATDPYDPATQQGAHGPYFQSQRLEIYQRYVQQLLDEGKAYREDKAVRFRMDRDIAFEDAVFGPNRVQASDLEDFIILKGDGFPTYHLAVVVDDALMNVTHVIRGQEHLSNTPKHIALQNALGFPRPIYAHTPSIMNPDGSKMSKRDKAKIARTAAKDQKLATLPDVDTQTLADFLDKKSDAGDVAVSIARQLGLKLPEIDVADFRDSGYLSEVLCNYIALLGWNPGNDVEKFDRAFLVEHFSLERVGRANARFDRNKLLAFNGDALAAMPPGEFVVRWVEHLGQHHADWLKKFDSAALAALARLYQPRSRTLEDLTDAGRFFLLEDDALVYDEKAVKKALHKNDGAGLTVLRAVRDRLQALPTWDADAIHAAIEAHASENNLGMGDVAQPLRVAVSGGSVSPPIQDTLALLGKDATLRRIDHCLSQTTP